MIRLNNSKKNTLFCLCLLAGFFLKGQHITFKQINSKLAVEKEWPNPKKTDTAAWSKIDATIQVGFADIDTRFEKNSAPPIAGIYKNWQATAWKGEKIHTQILISSKTKIAKTQVLASPLTSAQGNTIPANAVTTGLVRYVLSDGLNKEGRGCGIAPANESDSFLTADGIDFIGKKNIDAFTTQPVWLSVAVPSNTIAGKYTGKLVIQLDKKTKKLEYTITVKDHELPTPKNWQFHLDLWQNPYSISRYFSVKDWEKEHLELMRPYMQMLAAAGQKTITVSMIHDPWQGQTFDIYKSMIKWTKKKDGGWVYDYTVFDKWVQFMMSLDINKLINCYSMVPWNNKFYYYDEALGKDTLIIAKTGTPEYEAHWKPMLADFAKHLKQKGWFDKTAIAMDERPLDDMQKVIALVHSVDKDFKISLAGSYHKEIADDIYDYCIASAEQFDTTIKNTRLRASLPTTYYTCCVEGRPNTFTFSPPAESAWLAWYAAAQNYNGYLRWAYNCWPQNPMQDSRFGSWSSGDTYFVYPGGSSIRFERLVEGIQDYEKIRLLKALFTKNKDTSKLRRLNAVINEFSIESLQTQSAAAMLLKAKKVLNSF